MHICYFNICRYSFSGSLVFHVITNMYCSLCFTIGLCCLCILYIMIYIIYIIKCIHIIYICIYIYVCVCVYIYIYIYINRCYPLISNVSFTLPSPTITLMLEKFSSVTQLCLTLCDSMDCSTPGLSLLKLMYIESVMPSNHLILWHPLLFLPSIFPRIRVFSNESALRIRWPKYWSFSFSIIPSNEHPGLISFRIDWLESKGLLRIFSNTTVQKHQFFGFLHSPTLTSIHDHWT